MPIVWFAPVATTVPAIPSSNVRTMCLGGKIRPGELPVVRPQLRRRRRGEQQKKRDPHAFSSPDQTHVSLDRIDLWKEGQEPVRYPGETRS